MTNEIKEILDDLDYCKNLRAGNILLKYNECDLLLDYITNLQEKLNRIDKLINIDYSCVSYYYKYNNRYLKSEIKEDINNILRGDE